MEFRVALNHVDRKLEVEDAVIIARHPSETGEHLNLRVLAWCLLHEERLAFGPGLSDPEAADLWTHDLTGRLTTWIECGTATPDRLKRLVQHNTGAQVHVVFGDERRRQELLPAIAEWKRGQEALTVWTIDQALVKALALHDERRHKWAATIVGDHIYLDADGEALDGAVSRDSW